jgi:glucokinase
VAEPFVVGVDLGGTNVRAQALAPDGSPRGDRAERPSRAQEGTKAIVEAISATVGDAVAGWAERAVGVGLAVPGHIDTAAGTVRWAPNFGETVDGVFRYWEDVPLGRLVAEATSLSVVMGNDANCAALGEYRFGSGQNTARCLVLVTLGTGIGGGVVMAPESVFGEASGPLLLLGGNQGGAELGHICIAMGGLDCNAGSYGALEAYCQRDSIVRRAQHRLLRDRGSLVLGLVGGDVAQVTPKALAEAADAGDEVAREVWAEVGRALGSGLGSLINVFAPDVLAIGGQVSKAGQWLLGPAEAEARNVAIPSLFRDCRIVPAEVADDAGVLGAAALAWGRFGGRS